MIGRFYGAGHAHTPVPPRYQEQPALTSSWILIPVPQLGPPMGRQAPLAERDDPWLPMDHILRTDGQCFH